MDSEQQQQKQPTSGWKWEVNHDGVIWSWCQPYSLPLSLPVSPSPLPASPVKQKKSLVDYWYAVHDGIAIPWNGEH